MKRDATQSENGGLFDRCHRLGTPTRRSFLTYRHPIILSFCAVLIATSIGCSKPEDLVSEKNSTLNSDERYIVQLYMKINDLEKNLQENPSDSLKKWDELRSEIDEDRIRAILSELEKDPERWLAVYGRVTELLDRKQ